MPRFTIIATLAVDLEAETAAEAGTIWQRWRDRLPPFKPERTDVAPRAFDMRPEIFDSCGRFLAVLR
jgi:hypothetical protein